MSQLKAKLFAALDKIGNQNGHACPESQDPADALIHEYNVTTQAESYFKKRRDNAKAALEKALTDDGKKKLLKSVVSVKTNETPDTCTVIDAAHYSLVVDVKNGASFLDVAALKNAMARKLKMQMTEVEAMFEAATDRREPTQSWKAIEK